VLRRPLGILSKSCPKSRIPRISLACTLSYSLVSRILQSAKSCSCHNPKNRLLNPLLPRHLRGHPKPANDKTRGIDCNGGSYRIRRHKPTSHSTGEARMAVILRFTLTISRHKQQFYSEVRRTNSSLSYLYDTLR